MKSKLMCFLIAVIAIGCSTAKNNPAQAADDYGYSEKNPIKVGGGSDGPMMERQYLNRLTGTNGEKVTFNRRGSCCQFESKNAVMGMGLLDIYEVKIEGDPVAKTLYINMYDSEKLYAPKGFVLK